MAFPSEIVAYLEARFPAIESLEEAFTREHAAVLSHVLELIEALPAGIVTLTGDALAEYGESVGAVRLALNVWQSGANGYVFTYIPGRGRENPLALIHKHLRTVPDEVIAPETTDLPFITDPELKEALRLDMAAAKRSYDAADWKGCTVQSGSLVEALLLWALDQHETKNPGAVNTAVTSLKNSNQLSRLPDVDRNKWHLHELTEICHYLSVIKENTAAQCRIATKFRNLIHPGRAIRLAQRCNRGTALSALAAVEHVVEDLS